MFFGCPAVFGLSAVAEDFIPFFLGNEYLEVIPVLKILSVLILTISFNSVVGVQLLLPLGKDRAYTTATIAGAVTNMAVNVVLIPKFGIYGACAASILAEVAVFIVSFLHVRKILSLTKILKDNLWTILSSVIMYVVVRGISLLDMHILLKLLIEITCGGFVYVILMFIGRNEILIGILEKVFGILKKVLKK